MEPPFPPLPELVHIRTYAVAAPEIGQRDLRTRREPSLHLGVGTVQRRSVGHHVRLAARPRAELALSRTGREVRSGFRAIDRGDRTGDPHLALYRMPREDLGGARFLSQVARLRRLEVRVEDEATLVQTLEQNGPR